MSALLVVMLLGSLVALALGVRGVRRVGRAALLGEAVMLAAMVDTHVPPLGLVPAVFWAVLLGGCAMTTAAVDRFTRQDRPAGDHLHAIGMLLGAVFVLLGASGHSAEGGHDHAVVLLLPVGVVVAVHTAVVVRSVAGSRVLRHEVVRRVASLVGVLAMGAMSIAHG